MHGTEICFDSFHSLEIKLGKGSSMVKPFQCMFTSLFEGSCPGSDQGRLAGLPGSKDVSDNIIFSSCLNKKESSPQSN